MLQRAASNAYSWWWASHVRTKQSKWLEQSLQDMEEKVQDVIKLIEEDGDSFAKRAEMYYKKRPELIHFVEESFRAFRALADRYDLLSKDLQNANHTIATVFPEQVQFAMDEDDECAVPKISKYPQVPPANIENDPKIPKAPIKDLKGLITTASKKFSKKPFKTVEGKKTPVKSGLSKNEALEEIDKLQKDILELQTVKEFVKSSYETGVSKYWEIENQIMEMQQKVCRLQDEFNVDSVIEDDEARTLMAGTALRSCQETLTQLQEKQQQSIQSAQGEANKIKDARNRLKSLKSEYLHEQGEEEKPSQNDKVGDVNKEKQENNKAVNEKLKDHIDLGSMESLTVTDLAERIDELVDKVISLETSVSSQTLLINRLRTEADDLHMQIKNLEDEKETPNGIQDLSSRIKEMEEKLRLLQDLNKDVECQNSNIQTNFAEARSGIDILSEKVNSMKPDEKLEVTDSLADEKKSVLQVNLNEDVKDQRDVPISPGLVSQNINALKEEGKDQKDLLTLTDGGENLNASQEDTVDQKDEPNLSADAKNTKASMKDVIDRKDEPKLTADLKNINASKVDMKDQRDASEIQEKDALKEVDMKQRSLGGHLLEENEQDKKAREKSAENIMNQKPQEQLSVISNDDVNAEALGEADKGDEMNWQQLLLSGLEDREKVLLKEYTAILRNYKDVKKKLSDMEKKDMDCQFDTTLQIRELKNAIKKRDEEIQQLRQKLNLIQGKLRENEERSISSSSTSSEDQPVMAEPGSKFLEVNENVNDREDEIKMVLIDRAPAVSIVEEKLRMDIDAILDENLDFWLRFSTAFHQIQKFKTEVQDLQDEVSKLKEKKKQEGSGKTDLKSEVRPIYKHLREIQTELTVWLDQSVLLKDELKRRMSSLCSIQEEITKALKEGVEEEEIVFSSHQAAKFQGEVLNMKQENNKVREELQAGLDHVSSLQLEIETTLKRLNNEFGISSDQPQLTHSASRSRVPLRSFIFGSKPKKPKYSLFSSMNPNRRYQVLRAGASL